MELQRDGAGQDDNRQSVLTWKCLPGRWLVTWVTLLLSGMVLWTSVVDAQSTNYVHDANGRVVAVTANNGTSVQYSYDSLGHANQISAPLSAGQLALFAFTPTHGVAGTEVTLQGQGFSSSAASDTVSFNGTVTSVLAASATQLTVSVPSGATAGPVSVTVGGQTVTSPTSFVIDDTGTPPAITQVSPEVAVGGTVTVTGTHLDPVADGTTVQMGGLDMLSVSSLADTQLQYTVPSNAVSGHVTVNTPYGSATSAVPVALLPSSVVSELSGAPTSYIVANGNAVSFSTGAAGQSGVLTFDAPQGGNDELTLSNIAITGSSTTQINVNVYGPTGTVVSTVACYTTNPGASCRIALWNLVPGTYTAVVSPETTSSIISFNAIVASDIVGPTLAANTPATVNLATGQLERFTFSANAGTTVALQLSGVSTVPTGQSLQAYIYSPATSTITTGNYYTSFTSSGSNTINLTNLPATGTYTVIVFTNGIPASGQITLAPSVTGTLTSGGAAQSYSTDVAGQNAYLSFTANAGDNLELTLAIQSLSAGSGVSLSVYNSAGTSVGSLNINTSDPANAARLALWNLAAGTYTVIVSPQSNSTMSFSMLLQPDVTAGALTANTAAAVNLQFGQIERFTFTANAGDTVALNMSGVATTPSGQALCAYVFSPTATTITTSNYFTMFSTASSTTVNLANLPATGTYTVVLFTVSGSSASAQLTLVPGTTGTLASGGTAQSYSTSVAGQDAYLSFTASAGANLELTLAIQSLSAGSSIEASVYNSAGTNVGSLNINTSDPSDAARLAIWNLAAGTYTVIVSPQSGGTMSFSASLQPDVMVGALTANTPATVNLQWGQIERFTFTADAGDAVALDVSGVTTTPSGQPLYAYVFSPTATTITTGDYYTTFNTASSTTANLTNLPATGTYTVVFFTVSGNPASAQVTLVPQ
jgi:hypothetical protein